MITVVYSFNKVGYEAEMWRREIVAGSSAEVRFVAFNHEPYLAPQSYIRAQLLDDLYYREHSGLLALYDALLQTLEREKADVLLVDTCPPYHPEFLRGLSLHKVLRIADGPAAAYDRDFAYLHAYDQILYHSPAYSRDLEMPAKLAYCGAKAFDLWPLALFDGARDAGSDEETVFARKRDIDIVFVGGLHPSKMPILARVKKEFGKRCVLRGLSSVKKNLYFNAKYGFPGWVSPISARDYVSLYQRARIGFNVHNRGKYTVGGYRLFELPGNGVMQISDGGEYLGTFLDPGREVVGYDDADDLIDKLHYYLEHEEEREAIARAGYRRVLQDHRIALRLSQAGSLISTAMDATSHRS